MPPVTAAEEKRALRTRAKAYWNGLSPEHWDALSHDLLEQFLRLPLLNGRGAALLYHGMGREVPTGRIIPTLLERGWKAALPRCLPGGEMEFRLWDGEAPLIRHPYGMLEPGEDCPLYRPGPRDVILVPGLMFDRKGYRLGRGGGYYDRYLASCSGITVGLCPHALLEDVLPRETHDRPVEWVVTERGTYETGLPQGSPVPPRA